MPIMIDIIEQEQIVLRQLAHRLRQARLQRNESQEVFAARLGLSRQSYSKMENGAATTPIGVWLAASALLGRLATWEGVLTEQENLFERFEQLKTARKRAGKKGTEGL
jgi:transcriptional regulator with XRE-family HTH domain